MGFEHVPARGTAAGTPGRGDYDSFLRRRIALILAERPRPRRTIAVGDADEALWRGIVTNPAQATSEATRAAGNGTGAAVGALPNLIVIGAQKCGTSGLHYYLSLHPEISMSRPKELNFFIEERNWPRGVDWYRRHFDAARARSRRVLAELHRLPAARRRARAHARAPPRREADLHRPRPARADRRALGPQLRQAAREGRPCARRSPTRTPPTSSAAATPCRSSGSCASTTATSFW